MRAIRISVRSLAVAMVMAGIANGELPTLSDPQWSGTFAVFVNRHFQILISGQGRIDIQPRNQERNPVGENLIIHIELIVEETMPNGRVRSRALKPESLQSTQPATAKFDKALIQGQVTNGAPVELSIEQRHGKFQFGARLLPGGPSIKNPQQLLLRTRFPAVRSANSKDSDGKQAKPQSDPDSNLVATSADNKRKKAKFEDSADIGNDPNSPPLTAVAIEHRSYPGTRFVLTASPQSKLAVTPGKASQLRSGFLVRWLPSADSARLTLELR